MSTLVRRDEFVRSVAGVSVAGAQVYVCTQPADTVLIPPAPLATIYGDPLGVNLLTQPVVTDGLGHAYFYLASGTYTIVVVNDNEIQQVYPDQSIGIGVTLETNGTPNSVQTLENLIAGNSMVLTADLFGSTTVSVEVATILLETNSVENEVQDLLNLQNTDGSVVLQSDGSGNVTISAPTATELSAHNFYTFQSWPAFQTSRSAGITTIIANKVGTSLGSGTLNLLSATQTEPIAYSFGSNFDLGVSGFGIVEERATDHPPSGSLTDNPFTIGLISLWQCRLALVSGDGARHWIGISSNPTNGFGEGGNAAVNSFIGTSGAGALDFVGFRFSPAAGADDVHWMAYVGGSALGSDTVASTGVVPTFDSVSHVFQIESNGVNFLFFIDGTQVQSIPIPSLYFTSFGISHGTWGSIISSDTDFSPHPTMNYNVMWIYYELNR